MLVSEPVAKNKSHQKSMFFFFLILFAFIAHRRNKSKATLNPFIPCLLISFVVVNSDNR